MGSRTEDVLTVIANGETTEINPRCRKEQFLKAIANGDGTANLPEPKSREEQLLMQIAEKGVGGGGTTIVTEDITITPTTSDQVKTRSSGKYINKVTVKAIPSEYIIPSGSININVNGIHNVKSAATVNVNVPSSGITPTGTLEVKENGKHDVTNYADIDVNVPIPDGYIVPEGNLEVTENDTYDVTTKKTVTVNVASSGGGEFFDRTFANNTPEQISKVSALIAYNNMTSAEVAETFGWNIGDTTKITLSTGEVIEMRIIGFNHDTRTGGGKAGITLDMTHCLATKYSLNGSDTYANYIYMRMRTTTLPTIKETLPQEWQDVIKSVDKTSMDAPSFTTATTSSEELFLLSAIEINGKTNKRDEEGPTYEYYTNNLDGRYKSIDTNGDSIPDTVTTWWLRTPSTSSYRGSTMPDWDYISDSPVSRANAVSFAFCV